MRRSRVERTESAQQGALLLAEAGDTVMVSAAAITARRRKSDTSAGGYFTLKPGADDRAYH